MLSLLAAAALATPPPAPGVIAFIGSKNGQIDLFTVRSDGSELTQLTDDAAAETEPTWSPDGTRLAFISAVKEGPQGYLRSYVYVIKSDGTNRIQATTEPMEWSSNICWSPDGTKLAFIRTFGVGIGSNICAVGATGAGPSRVTNVPTNDRLPTWSASNKLAFLGTRGAATGIFTMNADGTAILPLITPATAINGPLHWSPDGSKILYNRANSGGITIARADGSQPDSIGESAVDDAEFSRDGRKVVFTDSGRYGGKVMISTDAMVATPVPGTDGAASPTFSPDGAMIAFAKSDGTDPTNFYPVSALYVAQLGQGSPVKLPITVRPVRSADGKKLFYVRWSPTGTTSPSGGNPETPPDPKPVVPSQPPAVPTGPGFPGTPVGPDRSGNALGAPKASGKDLVITMPATVTVGDAFFGPEPLTIKVTRSAKLAKTPVKYSIVGAPSSITAVVKGSDAGAKLTLGGLSSLAIGEYSLQVKATCGAVTTLAPVRVVRKQARILLVDDDLQGNNAELDKDPSNFAKGTLSKSDAFYRDLLERGDGKRSLIFDTVGVDRYGHGPDSGKLQPYDFVLWYIGTSYGGNPDNTAVFSGTDETNIRAYLGEGGGRTMMLVGPGYLSNVSRGLPTSSSSYDYWTETDSLFLKKAIGVAGGRGMLVRFTEADLSVNGETFMMGRAPMEAQLSPINPSTSTSLATAELDPDGKGTRMVPVATWNRVGDANLIYLGFTLENVTVKANKLAAMLLGIRIRGMANR